MISTKYINILRKARLKSNCKIKMSAIAISGGRILAIANNTEGSAGNGVYRYSRHAEDNLLRLLNVRRRAGASNVYIPVVYVYREHGKRSGKALLSRPCRLCEHNLRAAGVKRVIFSTASGWEVMRL